MDMQTVIALNKLNEQFYCANGASFDRSRQDAWPGWNRVTKHLLQNRCGSALSVLDVACGNMRFEKFLASALLDVKLEATCVDSCDDLVVSLEGCTYRHVDVVTELLKSTSLSPVWGREFDLVVSFGFFHHIPSAEFRLRLLEALVEAARPGGLIAISLWRFASDRKLLAKAQRTTEDALASLPIAPELEEGDYLLGWNDVPDAYRYCHSFDEREIDSIVSASALKADLIDQFRADGRTGALNEYLVLRKR